MLLLVLCSLTGRFKRDSPVVFALGILLTWVMLYLVFEVVLSSNVVYLISSAVFAAVMWLNGLIYVRRKR